MKGRTTGAAVLAAAGLVLGAAPAHAVKQAQVRTCDPRAGVLGSLDGDRVADVVVGLPDHHAGVGALDVHASATGTQRLTHASLGLGAPTVGDGLGAAAAVGDVDLDGCADVVFSAPGRHGQGTVQVAFGSPQGLRRDDVLTLPYTGVAGDRFGAALAVSRRGAGDRTVHDLWVGVPGWDEAGARDAGGVVHYVLRPGRRGAAGPRVDVASATLVTESTPRVPGFAETGDQLGEVLAAAPWGVLVGEPHEDVGPAVDAGSATWLAYDPSSGDVRAASRSQGSPGVPGVARPHDGFGRAVALGPGGRALVGVPGDTVGGRQDAGSAVRFDTAGGWRPGRASRLTQDTPGIPGEVDAGDRFGAAVLLGRGLRCRGSVDAAVGAPGEDTKGRDDSGTVTVLPFRPDGNMACTATVLTEGGELSGRPGRGDRVGAALALLPRADAAPGAREQSTGSPADTSALLVGVPGEDVAGVVDAGSVQTYPEDLSAARTVDRRVVGFSPGPAAGLRYGAVLAQPAARTAR